MGRFLEQRVRAVGIWAAAQRSFKEVESPETIVCEQVCIGMTT